MVYFHCERVISKILSHSDFFMSWTWYTPTNHDCFQIIACSDNLPPYVIEKLMKYSLFFLRIFAHNLRNIKCLLWVGACEIIYNFIFLNYFNTGTISAEE